MPDLTNRTEESLREARAGLEARKSDQPLRTRADTLLQIAITEIDAELARRAGPVATPARTQARREQLEERTTSQLLDARVLLVTASRRSGKAGDVASVELAERDIHAIDETLDARGASSRDAGGKLLETLRAAESRGRFRLARVAAIVKQHEQGVA